MSNKDPLAFEIKRKKYTGPNPFTYSQARDYPRTKVSREFVPTSKYWNRFNVSNEILVGTRGSGKTILLRSLTYSSLRLLAKGEYQSQYKQNRDKDGIDYIGFYVPLRLRVLREIGETGDDEEERRRFSFLFNCVCAGSILEEVRAILRDKQAEEVERLVVERKILNGLKVAWSLSDNDSIASLGELQGRIDRVYDNIRNNWEPVENGRAFDTPLLEPIISILPILEGLLCIDKDRTAWLACFDEAEYLSPNLQRVFNTVMRSESRGLAVKIATLPFHYKEFRTEVEGEFVQPDGDDFRFESIDYAWDENDFIEITDNLVRTRLLETRLFEDVSVDRSLEEFIGENTNKDLISIYKHVFKIEDNKEITEGLIQELNDQSKGDKLKKYSEGQIKKLKPVFLLRELYKMSREGNTKVPWLSGPFLSRRVSGGNVRRFIQICDKLFEKSRVAFLRQNQQHEAVYEFSERHVARAKSVYSEGFLLDRMILLIASYISRKMHGRTIMDVGIEFSFSDKLLANEKIIKALQMGVAYSYFTCPEPDLFYGITSGTSLRLANSVAAKHWLPMRAGTGIRITDSSEIGKSIFRSNIPLVPSEEVTQHNFEMDLTNG